MNTTQKRFLDLLLEVEDICRRNNITYYLAGGTALGAVRNGGFLPWDDDVDLYITRENWEKLERVIDEELRPDRELVSARRYEHYRNPIGRYVDKTNAAIMLSQAISGAPTGQHVEFLILDPVPRSDYGKRRFLSHLLVYAEILTPYFVVNRRVHRSGSHYDPELLNEYLQRVKTQGREPVLKALEDILFDCPDTDPASEYYSLRWGLEIFLYKREFFGTPRLEYFEGHLLPVASKAESIFREAYGDTWMMVPEQHLQERHTAIRSDSISYVNYANDYLQFIDRDEALADYRIFKERKLSLLDAKDRETYNRLITRATFEELAFRAQVQPSEIDRLLRDRNYSSLGTLLSAYLGLQLSSRITRWDIFLDVGSSRLSGALEYLIHTGRYFDALTILRLSRGIYDSDPRIMRLTKLATALQDLSIAIYDNQCADAVRQILAVYEPEIFLLPELAVAHLNLKVESASSSRSLAAATLDIQNWLESNPRCWEGYMLLGDCFLKLGCDADATEQYKVFLENSRNGIHVRRVLSKVEEHDLPISVAAVAYTS